MTTGVALALAAGSPVMAEPSDALDRAMAAWDSQLPEEGVADVLPPENAFPMSAWHDGEHLYVGMEVQPGYYLYRDSLDLIEPQVASTGESLNLEPYAPAGELIDDPFFGKTRTYPSAAIITSLLSPEIDADQDVKLEVAYQGCAGEAGICFPESQRKLTATYQAYAPESLQDAVRGDVALGSQGSPRAPGKGSGDRFLAAMEGASLPAVLGIFFLAGLALTFTPCVLPMLPILSSIIVGRNAKTGTAFRLSAAYVAGVITTYTALGIAMGLFGSGLNLQGYLQSPPVLLTFAALFVLLALVMAGVVSLPSGGSTRLQAGVSRWQDRLQTMGLRGTAGAGALSVLVVSPCVSAPLAAALVFISTTGDATLGGLALMALSSGMSFPLLLVGTFGTRLMPKAGAWMESIKMGFAFMLGGVAIWLASRLISEPAALGLWGIFVLLGGLTIRGMVKAKPPVYGVLAALPLIWGASMIVGAAAGSHSPLSPLEGIYAEADDATTPLRYQVSVDTLKDLRSFVKEEAVADSKPVLVKFTADWCASCKVMDRRLQEPAVAEALGRFQLLEVDVTRNTSETREVLDECDLFGPPGLMFFHDGNRLPKWSLFGEVPSEKLREHILAVERSLEL